MNCKYCKEELKENAHVIYTGGELAHSCCKDEYESECERGDYYKRFPNVERVVVERLWYESENEVQKLNNKWCIVFNTDYGEYCASGFNKKESVLEAIKKHHEDLGADEGCWRIYGVYHNQKPTNCNVSITVEVGD